MNYNENLIVAKARAAVLVLRGAHSDYTMLVGVWQVRENVRNALTERFISETDYRLLFGKKF